jgi:hypothetical protein
MIWTRAKYETPINKYGSRVTGYVAANMKIALILISL